MNFTYHCCGCLYLFLNLNTLRCCAMRRLKSVLPSGNFHEIMLHLSKHNGMSAQTNMLICLLISEIIASLTLTKVHLLFCLHATPIPIVSALSAIAVSEMSYLFLTYSVRGTITHPVGHRLPPKLSLS